MKLALLLLLTLSACTPIMYCRDQPTGTSRCDVAVRIPTRLP